MDVSFLPTLDPRSSLYSERYATFQLYTNQNERISEWISERFHEEITSQLVNTGAEEGKAALSVLGIGSGDGRLELKMLMGLMKKFPRIECTVLEPSAERISSYQKLVKEQKGVLLNHVTFDWKQETFQEFFSSNVDSSKKFHFVSAIHSWYFMGDLDFYLRGICGWTRGKLLIMQTGDTSICQELPKKFPNAPTGLHTLIHGRRIVNYLNTLGIHLKTSVLPSECDVTSCFDDDSTDGQNLLDFILFVVGCKDNGTPELLEMIREHLKSEGVCHTKDGRHYALVPTQVIIAST